MLSCEKNLVLNVGSLGRTMEKDVGAGDFPFVVGESGMCSVQKGEDIIRFGDVGAVAGNDRWQCWRTPCASRKGKQRRAESGMGREMVKTASWVSSILDSQEKFEKVWRF